MKARATTKKAKKSEKQATVSRERALALQTSLFGHLSTGLAFLKLLRERSTKDGFALDHIKVMVVVDTAIQFLSDAKSRSVELREALEAGAL